MTAKGTRRLGACLLQTVKKVRQGNGYGKEDSVKETQEGCLSRSIIKFFEHFHTFSLFEKLAQLVKEQVL
jgi:hypothetical protein